VAHTGLVLTGGGARAAYQVGVLQALAELSPPRQMPFDVLAGISAGAINGIAVATGAEDFRGAVKQLAETWRSLTPDRIFRTGALKLASIGTRWIRDLSAGGLVGKNSINYLLDSAPLRDLLRHAIPVRRMRRQLRAGRLHAVAVSATNYHTGVGVTFFEGAAEIEPWLRSTRMGIRQRITHEHVMASAAIPVFFPPVALHGSYYGDGCVRMTYPLSPAIHLGADRVVAVSVRHMRTPEETLAREALARTDHMPLSEIAGVLLNAVFLDSVDSDLERLNRTNRTLELVPPEKRDKLEMRPVPALALRPSQDLGKLAADEYDKFPAMLRYLLRGIGASGHSGEDLLSYLAFEPNYVRRVMDLGYTDTMARRDEIEEFLLGGTPERQRPAKLSRAGA
jgi:NTE family protein